MTHNCSKQLFDSQLLLCSQCKVLNCCSKECQVEHWHIHKSIRCAIKQAESHYEQKTIHPTFMYNRLGEPKYYVQQVQNPTLYRNQVAVQTPIFVQPVLVGTVQQPR